MQVRNLFIDRFCLRLLAVRGADSQEQFTQTRTDRPTDRPTEVAHDCSADLTNNYLVKTKTIENGYAKDQSRKQTKLQTTIDQSQATHLSAVRSQQSERLIWERSDRNKPYQGTIDQTRERVQAPLKVWNRCEFWIRGKRSGTGQEPGADRKAWCSGGWCKKINSRAISNSIC